MRVPHAAPGLGRVSAALGVPYAYLSNDMLKANYSNSRLALLEFRRRVEAYQHAVIVWQLCREVMGVMQGGSVSWQLGRRRGIML